MSLDIREFTKEELVKAIAKYVKEGPYLFPEEIADSLFDGSWIQFYNGKWENLGKGNWRTVHED